MRLSPVFRLVFLFASLLPATVGNAALPPLSAPVMYAARHSQENELYQVRLYLGASHEFVLHEELTLANGKVSGWDVTGRWHQIRGGTFLQLTNNSDFFRLVNVGGSGDLYLGMRLPAGKEIAVILRRTDETLEQYTMAGNLRLAGKDIFLEDVDSGMVYSVLPGKAVAAFYREHAAENQAALPVRATVTPAGSGASGPALHVHDIRSGPGKKWTARGTSDLFSRLIAEKQWMVTRIGPDVPDMAYMLSFYPEKGEKNGRLEVFDGSIHRAGAYSLQGDGLSLSVETTDDRFAGLIRQTRSWRVTGEVLELWDERQVLASLEKMR